MLSQELNNSTVETSTETEATFTEKLASENEKKHEYSHLNDYTDGLAFTSENSAELATEASEIDTESTSENSEQLSLDMTQEDAEIMAAVGVNSINSVLPMLFRAPVSIDEDNQEALARKAAPLVKKYYSGENVPDWLKKYQDEIGFGLALSAALFGCHQQAKAYKLKNLPKKSANDDNEKPKKEAA